MADDDPALGGELEASPAMIEVCDPCLGLKLSADPVALKAQFEQLIRQSGIEYHVRECIFICKRGSVRVTIGKDQWRFMHIDDPEAVQEVVQLTRDGKLTDDLQKMLY